jgi:thiol:disulfide interchange protein/DsbC/DsbD-like thiol-disulfide interchange protein
MGLTRWGGWGRRLLLSLLVPAGLAAQEPGDSSPHSDAWLVSEVASMRPGQPFSVGLRLVMEEGWHSYWRNAGDSGIPTSLEWELPDGFAPGEIQWPYPSRIERPPLVSYGYEREVLLLVEIRPPSDLAVGTTVTLAARADWLICEEPCYPASADVSVELPVRDAAPEPDRRWADAFAAARARLPVAPQGWSIAARYTPSGYGLDVSPPSGRVVSLPENPFFAGAGGVIDHAAPQLVARAGDGFRIRLSESDFALRPADRLEGVLLVRAPQADAPYAALAIAPEVITGEAGHAETPVAAASPGSREPLTLFLALAFALLGGLLLNLMPCVLPVLSIKVLGFVEQGGTDPAGARLHGAAYGLGVLICFWILAGALLLLRAAGQQLGWGFQLQSPPFVAFMALLFFALGLLFLGVVEVGASLTRLGAVGRGSGYGNSLLTGVLAVVVATPCTAPFMGAALGFALARQAFHGLAVFTALGIGMSLPYVALSASPALLRRLPRPGPWMESLKQFLAFPLFATVAWLLWVFGRQAGVDGASLLLLALTFLGLAAWILGRWSAPSRTGTARAVARAVAALILLLVGALAWAGSRMVSDEPAVRLGSEWQPFSLARVEELRSEGRPVFVDFTAAWCLTCQVNERVALADAAVQDAFRAREVALLKADWTKWDPQITEALRSFGRSGVPLYVLYSAEPGVRPRILPELLSAGTVLEALADL